MGIVERDATRTRNKQFRKFIDVLHIKYFYNGNTPKIELKKNLINGMEWLRNSLKV